VLFRSEDLNKPGTPAAKDGWRFTGWIDGLGNTYATNADLPPTVTCDVIYTAQWELIPYTITFLPGERGEFDTKVLDPVYYDYEINQEAPRPFAEFGYRFLYWLDENGEKFSSTYSDGHYYGEPGCKQLLPVTESMIYTAIWAETVPGQEWPDKIPSVAHADKWWDDYGIFCWSSSNGATDYIIGFAEDFWKLHNNVSIGFGTSGSMEFVVTFTEDSWTGRVPSGYNFKPERLTEKLGPFSSIYNTDRKNDYYFDFKGGAWIFPNPFVSGAKQAWLGSLKSFGLVNDPPSVVEITAVLSSNGKNVDITVKDGTTQVKWTVAFSKNSTIYTQKDGYGVKLVCGAKDITSAYAEQLKDGVPFGVLVATATYDKKAALGQEVKIVVKDSLGREMANKTVAFEASKTVPYEINGYKVTVVYSKNGVTSVTAVKMQP
jgi:uncharacterized repeat protein (TIGR02543 family)